MNSVFIESYIRIDFVLYVNTFGGTLNIILFYIDINRFYLHLGGILRTSIYYDSSKDNKDIVNCYTIQLRIITNHNNNRNNNNNLSRERIADILTQKPCYNIGNTRFSSNCLLFLGSSLYLRHRNKLLLHIGYKTAIQRRQPIHPSIINGWMVQSCLGKKI